MVPKVSQTEAPRSLPRADNNPLGRIFNGILDRIPDNWHVLLEQKKNELMDSLFIPQITPLNAQ
jgi:hypothetical protein